MADSASQNVSLLSAAGEQVAADYEDRRHRALTSRTRSASMSSMETHQNLTHRVGHSGPLRSERKEVFKTMSGPIHCAPIPENLFRLNQRGGQRRGAEFTKPKHPSLSIKDQNRHPEDGSAGRHEHLMRSGQLGECSDPYCTTCPTYYSSKEAKRKASNSSRIINQFHYALYGDAKGWTRRLSSYISSHVPGVMNPHAKVIQQWNKFFIISCLVAVFVDPLYFFLFGIQSDNKCIVLNKSMTIVLVVVRSVTDFIYFLHILLQFRLAYIAPESTVFGAGDLVDHPKKIALNYLKGYFFIDLFVALPLPQITMLLVLPRMDESATASYAKNLLRAVIYIPRLCRLLHMLGGSTGFIFESAWANFVINLLTYVLSGHVVGSNWYLFGLQEICFLSEGPPNSTQHDKPSVILPSLPSGAQFLSSYAIQRVTRCLQRACRHVDMCGFMDCGNGSTADPYHKEWELWKNSTNVTECFSTDIDYYGIYLKVVNLTTENSFATRYIYSLFWGFQQISTLAGNQVPSYFPGEILFTMAIIGSGLLLFALLIGNIQNFLQALGKRRLEMTLRGRDIELWMRHRRLPIKLRKRVRRAERYNWAATRGVNEETLLENLPEDLQRDIRRHLISFAGDKMPIFALMDAPILDVICDKLRQRTYIKGSKILNRNGLIEKMFFIVRGKLQSKEDNGVVTDLREGDVCGEELLAWCFEDSSANKKGKGMRVRGTRLHSYRTVKCLTNVEAFALRAADLDEVTRLFPRFFRNPRIQGAIRYVSPYWRGLAASRIQVAWRYWKKCQSRAQHFSAPTFSRDDVSVP